MKKHSNCHFFPSVLIFDINGREYSSSWNKLHILAKIMLLLKFPHHKNALITVEKWNFIELASTVSISKKLQIQRVVFLILSKFLWVYLKKCKQWEIFRIRFLGYQRNQGWHQLLLHQLSLHRSLKLLPGEGTSNSGELHLDHIFIFDSWIVFYLGSKHWWWFVYSLLVQLQPIELRSRHSSFCSWCTWFGRIFLSWWTGKHCTHSNH